MTLIRSRIALVIIVLLVSLSFLPNVRAQTTRIVELRHPIRVVAGGLEPFAAQAVVSYQDAKPGYSLVVDISEIDTAPQKIIPGMVTTASPDWCVNQPVLAALCVMKIQSSSGVENLEFKIGGILGGQPRRLGTWDLNMTASLFDANNNLIVSSVSSVPFGVEMTPLTLTITVPAQVEVAIDGVMQPPGPVKIGVTAGDHNASVSAVAAVNSSTRLRFDHWSDGYTQANRTVSIWSASSYEVTYVTQYRLTLTGEQGFGSGGGWYDDGSSAKFSVPQVESMSGLLGLLGGKLTFQGWYEDGISVTSSTSGTIIMNKPHTLTAQWQSDYTMPIAVSVIILIVAASGVAYLLRRRRVHAERPDETAPVPTVESVAKEPAGKAEVQASEVTRPPRARRLGRRSPSRRRRSKSSIRRKRRSH